MRMPRILAEAPMRRRFPQRTARGLNCAAKQPPMSTVDTRIPVTR
jgi:hypothetical protein